MAIQVMWDEELEHVIRWTYIGAWHWKDFEDAWQETAVLLGDSTLKCELILDVTQTSWVPRGNLFTFRAKYNRPYRRIGRMIIVGASSWLSGMWNVFCRLYAPSYVAEFVATLAEARALVRDWRAAKGAE